MLKRNLILDHARVLPIEFLQSEEEGKDLNGYQKRIDEITRLEDDNPLKEKLAEQLLDEMYELPIQQSFNYIEPSTLDEIKALRPASDYKYDVETIDTDTLYDRIYGAWLGRCAGCLLGQSIEGWKLSQLTDFLKETNNYPLKNYISSDIDTSIKQKYNIRDSYLLYGQKPSTINWVNNVDCMPEDDDINYTVAALKFIETYGKNFTSDDIAECWLLNIPLLHLCTAERIAYRNLSLCKYPPVSATYRNPYREWIGAQIRGDFWGYINPGNIELAAAMAFRDASVSHVKNGIYGEMFVSPMISAAAISDDIRYIINCGLSQIPETSRLAAHLKLILEDNKAGLSEQQVIEHIHSLFNENLIHHWCHTIPNAMIVCFALLYGEKDFEKSLSLAIMAAFDTDCNAATVGSIIGFMVGASQLPHKWTAPLSNTVLSAVSGFEKTSISSLAKRTINTFEKKD